MTNPHPSVDPYYSDPVSSYIRWHVEHVHNMELVVDDYLTTRGAVDPHQRVIWARPGLTLPDFQWLACRAVLYSEYPDYVPEFHGRHPSAPTPGAVILPFPRQHTDIRQR